MEIPGSFTKTHNKCITLFALNVKEKNLQLNQSFSEVAVLRNGESKYLQRGRSTNDFLF